jgi:hypothetical protein
MAIKGYVCHCPELKLYHYHRFDTSAPVNEQESDYKFDEDSLEMAIATHLANNQEDEAQAMAHLTGLARLQPHMFITFDTGIEKFETVSPANHFASLPKVE